MINPIARVIGGIDTRLKRLEESIGSATDTVLRFISLDEKLGTEDYIYIYKQNVNDSFLVGHGIIGVTLIGDRRDAPELIYEGDGT